MATGSTGNRTCSALYRATPQSYKFLLSNLMNIDVRIWNWWINVYLQNNNLTVHEGKKKFWSNCFTFIYSKKMEKLTFANSYSLKNIPLPTETQYRKKLISQTEKFMRRFRWRAYFILLWINGEEPDEKFLTDNSDNERAQNRPIWKVVVSAGFEPGTPRTGRNFDSSLS